MTFTTEVPLDSLSRLASRLPDPETVDVTIEVVGEDIGDQIEARRLPWNGLTFDPERDVIELSVGGREAVPVILRHRVEGPSKVWVEEVDGSVRAVSIEAGDGPQTIVRFHERKALPEDT